MQQPLLPHGPGRRVCQLGDWPWKRLKNWLKKLVNTFLKFEIGLPQLKELVLKNWRIGNWSSIVERIVLKNLGIGNWELVLDSWKNWFYKIGNWSLKVEKLENWELVFNSRKNGLWFSFGF